MQRPLSTPARPAHAERAPERAAPWWLIASAMLAGAGLGFCGYLGNPTEERFLYGSLVLSGQVPFPDQALMLLYYRGVWSLLDQFGALAFSAGASFATANLAFVFIPPAVLTGALAMLAYGFTRRPLFSLFLAIVCFIDGSFALSFASPDYPLLGIAWDAPSSHSYGRFGQVLAAFAFAALVGGHQVLAAFTAASLIAVHPVVGAYSFTMIACGFGFAWAIWNRRIPRGVLFGFGAGLAVTAASLAVFLITRPTMPDVDQQTNQAYLRAYASFWDTHSNQRATITELVRVVVASLALAFPLLAFLLARRGKARTFVDIGAVALLGAIAASSLLYVMQHWAHAFLPEIVTRAIPGRLLNIQAALSMALLVSMIVFAFDELAHRQPDDRASNASSKPPPKLGNTIFLRHRNGVAAILAVILAAHALPGFAYALAIDHGDAAAARRRAMSDGESVFWSNVRERKITGLVLAPAGLAFKALRYGHLPIALDAAAFDFVLYLPRTATMFGRLIERGYGVSFFNPPTSVRLFVGSLPRTVGQRYWACLSPRQWRQLGQELGVAALLVPADWVVRLPPLFSDSHYALYAMPGELPPPPPDAAAEASCGLDHD